MINKYRGVQPSPPMAEAGTDPDPIEGLLSGGIVLNASAQDIPLDTSPDHDQVRVERGGLRADYGKEAMGTAAASRILALGEHRFVDPFGVVFEKIFRLIRSATFPKIESLNDVTKVWSDEITGDFPIQDVLHSWRSYFDKLFFADGSQVYVWDQSALEDDEGNDFPAANLVLKRGVYTAVGELLDYDLANEDNAINVVVSPANADADIYTVHFSLDADGPLSIAGEVVIGLYDGVTLLESRTVPLSASPHVGEQRTFSHLSMEIREEIAVDAVLTLKIVSTSMTDASMKLLRKFWLKDVLSTPEFYAIKGTDRPTASKFPPDDLESYTLYFGLDDNGFGGSCSIDIYIYNGSWQLVETRTGLIPGSNFILFMFNGETYPNVERVGINVAAADEANGWAIETGPTSYLEWDDVVSLSLHGFNLATDLDEFSGITYSTLGVASNTLRQVIDEEDNLIVGKYLGIQSDRLLVLQAGGDPQKIQAHVSGDPDTWHGEGSIETIPPSRSDPIDELMGHAMLTSNVGVLFRRRSIMRVISTGQLEPALAFLPWIEKLGTDSPFSIAMVPGGLMFLASDREVYYLTEQGPVAVGPPITEGFNLDDTNVASVEGLYDPITQEYTLSLPLSAA